MENVYSKKWDESYSRKENFIFFPKEEIVKFLNRYVRKKIGPNDYKDILDFSKPVRALDFGCGIGRQTLLMSEFGLDAFGIDISKEAISMAINNSKLSSYSSLKVNFSVFDGQKISFEENFFDIVIAESVLDSMHFDLAIRLVKEIDRVTNQYFFLSLISGDIRKYSREFAGEEIIESGHEAGTVQSYFNYSKIMKLIEGTNFEIIYCNLVMEESVLGSFKNGRYSIVLKKKS